MLREYTHPTTTTLLDSARLLLYLFPVFLSFVLSLFCSDVMARARSIWVFAAASALHFPYISLSRFEAISLDLPVSYMLLWSSPSRNFVSKR